jgi:subtilisin family serine protease
MKKALTLFALLVVSIAVVVLTTAHSQNSNSNSSKLRRIRADKRIANQYIVVLKDDVTDVEAEAVRLSRGFGGDRNGGYTYEHAIKGFSVRMSEERAAKLADDPRVEFVEEDGVATATATQANPPWGLDRIDQRFRPIDARYTYNATGTGVKVYIIDSGIRSTHTDFGGRVIPGFSAFFGGSTNDFNGHGTHVAATVGGSHFGVAKNVTLVAVRVLNNDLIAPNAAIIDAVDWVTGDHQQGQPAVANMSLTTAGSQAVDNAIARSLIDGVTYVVAAGNDNTTACSFSPARVQGALTVGATDINDERSKFMPPPLASNYGTCLDLFAPGTDIHSAGITNDTDTNVLSGTSMASPHVAGVAALYLEGNPGASPATVADAIINGSTKNVVKNAGLGSPNRLLYSLIDGAPPLPPVYEGFVDFASCDSIVGWAADRNQLNSSITVSIYDGSTLVANVVANTLRTDVGAYLGDNGLHGFAIPTPAQFKNGQTHTLRVRFESSSTDLTNSPKTLTCGTQTTYYEVVARHTGKCLDIFDGQTGNAARAIQWTCVGEANQHWQIIPLGNDYFKFIARHSNKVLGVLSGSLANGAAVVQLIDDGTAAQQWRIINTDNGYVRIMARHSNKALEVDGGVTFDGAKVQQWDYFGLTHQQWLLRPVN